MSTIYKYTLEIADDQDVKMPCGGSGITLLHVAFQGDHLCLWARVDPGFPERTVRIHVRGTGHPMGEAELGAEYVGTVMTRDQSLVFHVWAQTSPADRATSWRRMVKVR